STVSGNSAAVQGGGLYNYGTAILARTLISGNTAPTAPEIFSDGTTTADNFNLFGHSGASGVLGFTPGATDIVPNEIPTATLALTLASNGGPTQTHALVAASPAIDAVTDGSCPPPHDQRGVTRPQDGDGDTVADCDIGAFELEAPSSPRLIYGVQDTGASKSQVLTVEEDTLTVAALGALQAGRDISGLDLHPTTHTLYGSAGSKNSFAQKGFLFTVDKGTGALTPVGPTGFNSVEALSFRPTDGSLWGWAERKGLVTIDLSTGAATRVLKSSKGVEGLAWNNAGTLLYASVGRKLLVFNPASNRLTHIASNLPGPAEALEMRPDGLLAVGVDGSTAIQAYDPIRTQPVPAEAIPTGFNDVEGIAWPEAPPLP
ncbi:MAG: DUF4394 domain-containing protein, partial [candidate division NC10 bacterium]|nr:DUF4394 domain-containing protein [candidate division NC10 bacterium]